ncbi:heme NO-binding domain-containing protein [Tranquillimonas alkanivorans]|nr:heme NO-binding domain-containing protein [Tranquillimonas alkanivorans]
MHGSVNRALQCFLCDVHGGDVWDDVADLAELDEREFELLRIYDDALTTRVLDAAVRRLNLPRPDLLEQVGAYLVSHPSRYRLKHLLRFGSETFEDFLCRIEDLPGRAQLVLPDLGVPAMRVRRAGHTRLILHFLKDPDGFTHLARGALLAVAAEYGRSVDIRRRPLRGGGAVLRLTADAAASPVYAGDAA